MIHHLISLAFVVVSLGFVMFIASLAKKSGTSQEKERALNEALDDVTRGNAIADKYRHDPTFKKAVDTRFNR